MAFLDDLRQRLDIVQVISSYIPLQRAGKNYKALCPFHAERTPSFFVFPDRQTWRCFGACAQGGDVFSFVMRMERISFGEALRLLAQRAGLPIPPRGGLPPSAHAPLYQVNAEACQFYHHYLLSSVEAGPARDYLRRRGVQPDTIARFQVGVAPSTGDALKRHLVQKGYPEDLLEQAGLLIRRDDGYTRDLFVGRLLFPIADRQGRLIGFGGRSLDGSEPKYLNTPRTPIFDKGNALYALHLAVEPARKEGMVVVVEGYFDVLLLHQAGFTYVVASMGTSLTEGQARLLHGLAPTVVLALDPDTAGHEATLRTLEGAWHLLDRPTLGTARGLTFYQAPHQTIRIALLPPGQDPDELVLHNPEAWKRALADADNALDFLMRFLPQRMDISTPQGKQAVAERLLPLVFALPNPFEQERAVERLARTLGVSRDVLLAAGSGRRLSGSRPVPGEGRVLAQAVEEPVEVYLLSLLLQYPDLRVAAAGLTPDHFHRTEHRELFTALQEKATIQDVLTVLPEPLHPYVHDLLRKDFPPAPMKERQRAVAEAVRRLEERHLREMKQGEAQGLAPVPAQYDALEVNRRLRQVFHTTAQQGKER
ncbi:MAG: DNA primase [Dehalococcoidia bacterium]|nr:DNA primase [Dehalococcoidia bacterium]MDW8119132.1 DNA primase [Chloroflexota bacterium]